MLALLLVCFLLFLSCFCFVSCFDFADYENHLFPAILVFFSHVGYKVVLHFQFRVLVLVCFLLCCLFPFRHLICIILCLRCLLFSF